MFSLLRNQNFVRTFVADMISYVNYQETRSVHEEDNYIFRIYGFVDLVWMHR